MESLSLPPPPPPPPPPVTKNSVLLLPPPPPPSPQDVNVSVVEPLSDLHCSPNQFIQHQQHKQYPRFVQLPPHVTPFLPPPPPPLNRPPLHLPPPPPPPTSANNSSNLSPPFAASLEHNQKDDDNSNELTTVPDVSTAQKNTAQNQFLKNKDAITPKTDRKRAVSKLDYEQCAENGTQLPKELTRKFGPLKCDLCSVSVNSTVQAKMHYIGKQHEKKVHMFLLNWSKETGEPMPKLVKTNISSKKNLSPEESFCKVCNLALTSAAHAEQHYMGRNHKRSLAAQTAFSVKPENVLVPEDPTGRFGIGTQFLGWNNPDPLGLMTADSSTKTSNHKRFFCELCKISATNEDQLQMHYKGAKHRKAEVANMKKHSFPKLPTPQPQTDSILASVIKNNGNQKQNSKDYSIYRTPSGYYYCQPCNITLNSEAQFIQHCDSKKHKFKFATSKKTNKSGNIASVTK